MKQQKKSYLSVKFSVLVGVILMILTIIRLFTGGVDIVDACIICLMGFAYCISNLNVLKLYRLNDKYKNNITQLLEEKEELVNESSKNIISKNKFIDEFINLMYLDKKVPFYIAKSILNVSYSKFEYLHIDDKTYYINKVLLKNDKYFASICKLYEFCLIYCLLININEGIPYDKDDVYKLTLHMNNGVIESAIMTCEDKVNMLIPSYIFDNTKYMTDIINSNSEVKDYTSLHITMNDKE